MNYTDEQLKKTLAKMLPDKINFGHNSKALFWSTGKTVLDTELLHLCWLIEEELIAHQTSQYVLWLDDLNNPVDKRYRAIGFQKYHATWQQRVVALAKVKGIEIKDKE